MLTTEEIMQVALDLAGFTEVPVDSGIHLPGQDIKRALFGIDIGTAELMLARQLGCDAVIGHHPSMLGGNFHYRGTMDAWKVYLRHIDQLVAAGVPRKEAEEAVLPRAQEMCLASHRDNYDHLASAARLLGMPFLNIHSPLDEMGRRLMQERVDDCLRRNPEARVKDVVAALYELGEFRNAATRIAALVGEEEFPAGRAVVSHGALTNGGYPVAAAYYRHGVNTVIYIHVNPGDLERLRKENLGTLIVTGHVASDSVGINPFIVALEARGLEVISFSGIVPSR